MAKQTFSVGQVLTASQVNALQANDYNQTVSTKTASYILVAADKGTRIVMNSTSATTITVNTGLFDAGDTLYIHNTNSGVCTITAGTATVATSGSLVLAQNQGGVLYFTSASASIFFQYATPASGDIEGVTAGTGISGGGTSGTVTITNSMATEITAKGDLIVGTGNATFDNLAVGTNGHVLTADSTVSPTGLKWAAASGGGMTLLSTTTLSGSTTTTATISGTYNTLLAVIYGINNASNSIVKCLPNASAGNCYGARITQPGNAIAQFANSDIFITNGTIYANDANNSCAIYFHNFQTTTPVSFSVAGGYRDATSNNQTGVGSWGQWLGGAAITSLQFTNTAGTFTAGTVLLYGVK